MDAASVEYNLRPRSSRHHTLGKQDSRGPCGPGRRKEAIKVRPAPLSKYRRKTANARERTRMEEINAAFEKLQQVVPSFPMIPSSQDDVSDSSSSGNKQLTKITTLRLAMNYIKALSAILEEDKRNSNAQTVPPDCSDLDTSTIDDLMNMSTPSPALEHDPMLLCDCSDNDEDDTPVPVVTDTPGQLDTQSLLTPIDPNCHFDFLLSPDDT